MYIVGIWATAAEKTSNRPPTSSYGRISKGISFISGGVNLGSKIEKKKTTIEPKKKPSLIESYDSDENSGREQR